MILADKIINLRKKNGWSQEELAEKMNVSRQSVSKWEGAQSVPDLNKILLLSQIFGVSTDYLLKDDIEEEGQKVQEEESYIEEKGEQIPIRKVSMEEANEFLVIKEKVAGKIAFGVMLCILSPICVMILSVAQEEKLLAITEDAAAGMGVSVMFLMIAAAVALFIYCGMQTSTFDYLEKEIIETAYGVDGMVRENQRQYKDTYAKYNIIGACLCTVSVVPLFAALMFTSDDFVMVLMASIMLGIVAIAVKFFVQAGIRWDSMKILLQEEDYTVDKKKNRKRRSGLNSLYWLIAVALFLILFLVLGVDTLLFWTLAAIGYAIMRIVVGMIWKKE